MGALGWLDGGGCHTWELLYHLVTCIHFESIKKAFTWRLSPGSAPQPHPSPREPALHKSNPFPEHRFWPILLPWPPARITAFVGHFYFFTSPAHPALGFSSSLFYFFFLLFVGQAVSENVEKLQNTIDESKLLARRATGPSSLTEKKSHEHEAQP